jgi:hypothetical protein
MLPLAEKLAENGHAITFASPFASKVPNPNITDYVPQALKEWIESNIAEENDQFYRARIDGTLDYDWFHLFDLTQNLCTHILEDSEFIKWIDASQFDLMIVDALCTECAYGLSYKFGAKLILFGTSSLYPWLSEPFGYPVESSWIPDLVFHNSVPPTLYQRIWATLVPLYFNYLRDYKYFPVLEDLFREKLRINDMPSLRDYERSNVSLIFTNQYYSDDYPRPLPPNIKLIGGMHCTSEPGKVPKVSEKLRWPRTMVGYLFKHKNGCGISPSGNGRLYQGRRI